MSSAHDSNVAASDETPPVVKAPARPLDWSEQNPHAWILIICVAIISLACWLQVDGHEYVVVPWLNLALPQTCMFRNLTSWNCPGCGLTRSFISLADGHWHQAWQFNPVGWILFIVVTVQIPFRAFQLARLRSGRAALVVPGTWWWCWGLTILLITQWLVRGMGKW